jgi:hypothetical protein
MTVTTTGRRGLLRGAAAAGGLAVAGSALPYDLALAQGAGPGSTLRVGMTASAVPLANGVPDQGGEGHRFMGITLFDQLVQWDLSKYDAPAVQRPGLATAWRVDPADPRRWAITLREGVKFHDGKVMRAEDVVFSYDRAFRNDAPHFDPRAAAQARIRMPTIAAWRAEGPNTFVLETTRPDSLVPFGLTWVGITHQGAWEAAGRDWDRFMQRAVGTGPWKMESFSIRERCVMTRNADYWDAGRVPKTARLVLLPLPEANTRVAALRSGQVDFIEAPPPDAIPSLRQAGFQVVSNRYPHNWTPRKTRQSADERGGFVTGVGAALGRAVGRRRPPLAAAPRCVDTGQAGAPLPSIQAGRRMSWVRSASVILAAARAGPTLRITRPMRRFSAAKACSARLRPRARVALPRATWAGIGRPRGLARRNRGTRPRRSGSSRFALPRQAASAQRRCRPRPDLNSAEVQVLENRGENVVQPCLWCQRPVSPFQPLSRR